MFVAIANSETQSTDFAKFNVCACVIAPHTQFMYNTSGRSTRALTCISLSLNKLQFLPKEYHICGRRNVFCSFSYCNKSVTACRKVFNTYVTLHVQWEGLSSIFEWNP